MPEGEPRTPKETRGVAVEVAEEGYSCTPDQVDPAPDQVPTPNQIPAPDTTAVDERQAIEPVEGYGSPEPVDSPSYPGDHAPRGTRIPVSEARNVVVNRILAFDWNRKDLREPGYRDLASASIYRLCGAKSRGVADDIQLLRLHCGLEARRGRSALRDHVFDPDCNLSYALRDMQAALAIAYRAARALNENMNIEVLTPSGPVTLFFDPDEIAAAPEVADPGIAPGSRIRIRYQDTGEFRNIYIKEHADDDFSGPDFQSVRADSPIAQEMAGLAASDTFTMEINGRSRDCLVLEVYGDPT